MSVLDDLIHNLPKGIVITNKESLRPFECDGLSVYREKPLAVVLPFDISQIKILLEITRKHQIQVITRGAGTGLSGGATPQKNSIVLGLNKLNKIKEINLAEQYAVVEPGVANSAISQAVAKHNLYYAPDPSSQIICTIGGNVAENSGGVHCLKYGLTVNNIISIKFLDSSGTEHELHENDENIGLLSLMVGSEGLLGIITEVKVKLLKKPQIATVIMASFADVGDCADAVGRIIKNGIIPAGLEMMDSLAIKAAEAFVKVGYPLDANALLLCELDGNLDEVSADIASVKEILKGANDIKVSTSEQERLDFWRGRKAAFPAVGRLSPDYYCIDGTIPKRHLGDILLKINQLSKQYELRVANVFHAGDGNLHPLILYDANITGELAKTEKFGEEILNLCVDYGGTITGEHGVGIEKLNSMCYQFSTKELEVFHNIKAAFDEFNILNPTKAIPTLRRCAELGKMHVHHGKLPFAEIERF